VERHVFEGVVRVAAESVANVRVSAWLPPTINAAGHLIPAQPREDNVASVRENVPPPPSPEEMLGEAYGDAKKKGHQEGFADGRKEGLEQGLQEGLAKGNEQGLQKAQMQINEKLAELDGLMRSLTQAVNEQDYSLEQALLGLVQSISKIIIGRELSIDNRHIVTLVREALAAMPPSRDNVRIFVHPEDVATLDGAKELGGDQWKALPDQTLGRGGCRIETEQSLVDFTVEKRFQDLLEQILTKQLTIPLGKEEIVEEEFEAAPEPLVKKVLVEPVPEEQQVEGASEPTIVEEVEAMREAETKSGGANDGDGGTQP
jgi:flagellar assembly protein FliH